jgi:DNA-binding GntR family transcriptional regulator
MTRTLNAIRQRNPEAAVASLGRLLEEDRDRALATLSDLRKETFNLSAISQT